MTNQFRTLCLHPAPFALQLPSLFNTQYHFSIHPSLAMFLLLLILSFCLFVSQTMASGQAHSSLLPESREFCCMKTHPYFSFLSTIPQNSVLHSTLFYPCCSPFYCIPSSLFHHSRAVFLLFSFIPTTNRFVHTVSSVSLYYPQMIST